MKMDLHVHSNISPCSKMSLEDLIKKAWEIGLDGLCITDHASTAAKAYLDKLPNYGLTIIVGMEYSSTDGDFLVFGEIENIPSGLSGRQLLEFIAPSNTLAIAAHPFRQKRRCNPSVMENVLIVEGINGRCSDLENELTLKWACGRNQKLVGGSDAHTLDEIGKVVTWFERPIFDVWDLIENLKNHQYYPEIGREFEVSAYYFRRSGRSFPPSLGL